MENGDMPPEKKPQPREEQKDLVINFLDGELSKFDCKTNKNPGKVTIRRLNREEYRNTIRDLLKVNYSPEDFPNDEVGYGFDNIGDVLSISPMLMEKYLAAAEEIVNKAIVAEPKVKPRRLKGSSFGPAQEWVHSLDGDTLAFYREGEAANQVNISSGGDYIIRVRAFAEQAGPDLPKLSVRVDGQEVKVVEVTAYDENHESYEVRAHLEKGSRKVSLAFLNNYVDLKNADLKLRGDRNLYVDWVEVEGPLTGAPEYPESHKRLITKIPEPGHEHETARELLRPFITRAYRRPVDDREVDRIVKFVDMAMANKGTFLEGMQVAVQAVLCSPHFLFRWELDNGELKPGQVRELNDYEVASRLSYFLWSSMPDDELFSLAEKGELLKGDNLAKQTRRMLADWRSQGFIVNFSNQWLQIRNIWELSPDPQLFPKWSDELKGMMKQETERFFQAIVQEDRPVTDLLDANFTFLNEKLARFYGIEGVSGSEFRKVELPPDSPRGGVLTQGSVLMATSTPTRTSPVIRGKWILEQILGTPPPAPPPDVPPLQEQNHINQSASLRQRLEQHMSQSECAACHKRMDPLGFALENFDATGAWRDRDGKFPIDSTGKLPNGKSFNGARDLKGILKAGKEFPNSLTQKVMTYALGRGLEYYDRCAVDAIVAKMEQQGNKFSALVTGIVTSDPFLKRKTAEGLAQN